MNDDIEAQIFERLREGYDAAVNYDRRHRCCLIVVWSICILGIFNGLFSTLLLIPSSVSKGIIIATVLFIFGGVIGLLSSFYDYGRKFCFCFYKQKKHKFYYPLSRKGKSKLGFIMAYNRKGSIVSILPKDIIKKILDLLEE